MDFFLDIGSKGANLVQPLHFIYKTSIPVSNPVVLAYKSSNTQIEHVKWISVLSTK